MATAKKLPFSWHIAHDERGRVSCICPETGEVHAKAFHGFETNRGACGTIKYRCPATAFGFNCVGGKACHRAFGGGTDHRAMAEGEPP